MNKFVEWVVFFALLIGCFAAALAPTVLVVWVVTHFVSKFW